MNYIDIILKIGFNFHIGKAQMLNTHYPYIDHNILRGHKDPPTLKMKYVDINV